MKTTASLRRRILDRRAQVAIVGQGYVGVSLASAAGDAGFPVVGVDTDPARVADLREGHLTVPGVDEVLFRAGIASGGVTFSADSDALIGAEIVLVCVPTPLRDSSPDLSHIENACREVAERLTPGVLVVLESTTYPGTTDDVVRPILETSGLKSGVDFFLAYSPEREDPGNQRFRTSAIPKVVGGDGADALALAQALYAELVVKTVPVSSPATAEAVKLTENIFRAVNIALVNELKVVYAAMGIDVWEVIAAAETKPFGFMPFYPGPGLGGHCIPIDPFYLTWKAREFDVSTRFIELAGEINTRMPYHVVDRLIEAVDRKVGRAFAGAKVLILGVAYKKNVDDMRESPSLKLMELIEARGAACDYHDPFFPVLPVTRNHAGLAGRQSVALDAATVAAYDAVLIATDHDGVDYRFVTSHAKLVVDTRNACYRAGIRDDKVVKA